MDNASSVPKFQAFTAPVPVAALKPVEPKSHVQTVPKLPIRTLFYTLADASSAPVVSRSMAMGFALNVSLDSTR